MTFNYNRGIKIAERVIDYVGDYFYVNGVDENKYYFNVNTFYNCREQGFKVIFENEETFKEYLTFWIYAQRNSDEPTITWSLGRVGDTMYDEESYYNRTKSFRTESELAEFILDLMKKSLNGDDENE